VEFYAPWCGHCQSLKPAYEKAAKSLTGLAKVAAVNCDEESNKPLCGQFGVQGFPTLKIFKPGKKSGKPVVEDYQGPREAKAIVAAVSDKITNHVKRLQADTLDAWIQDGSRPKAILFSEKGTTAPLVKALAIDFLGAIDVAQVRNKEQAVVDKYEVTKFPTIVLLNKDGTIVESYDGEISKEALTRFLSQVASPNLDPAPKKAKSSTKPSGTKKSKSASASSAFSKASEAQKSSDFEEYLDHASTIILGDDMPTESPLPIVEHKQKPMVVADVAPALPTLATSAELRSACLQPSSAHCVLVLLPKQESAEAQLTGEAAEALSGFAAVEEKYSKRKASIFPAYAIPTSNEDATVLRRGLGLRAETQVDVVVLNMKKGWWKKYSGSGYDAKSIESFMDDVRFGEGVKQKLPANLFADPAAESNVPEAPEPVAQATPAKSVEEVSTTEVAEPAAQITPVDSVGEDSTTEVVETKSTHDEL